MELEVNSFSTEERKDKLLKTFHKRKGSIDDNLIQVKLIENTHYVATLLDTFSAIQKLDHLMQMLVEHEKAYCKSTILIETCGNEHIILQVDRMNHEFEEVKNR